MASRRLVSASVRDNLLGIASDIGSLERNYVLPDEDLALTATRRRPYNRLGLAIHIALLRHPGQGWLDGIEPPAPFVAWLGEQVDVSSAALIRYATRGPTRSEHRRLAIEHLGLHVFVPAEHMRAAIRLATRAAFDTDDGIAILQRLTSDMRTQRLVLPSADTLERIGLAGRARARRLSAQALNDALDTPRKHALMDLLKHDSAIGRSRLTWLRALPHSTSAASMQGLLERLRHVRMIDVPRDLGTTIHPARLAKFAREGAVAPLSLLNDFGERRRIATLAAQLSELDTTLTDAAIALFERLTAQLFTRSSRTRDQSWSASKTQVGRLIRLFGGAIDAMVRAREQDRDPFDVIDEAIGWDRMLASRDEIATLGDLATEDPLSLAAGRYTQLRRFAPAFLEIFEFDAPTALHCRFVNGIGTMSGSLRLPERLSSRSNCPHRGPEPAGGGAVAARAQPLRQAQAPGYRADAVYESAVERGGPEGRQTRPARLRDGRGSDTARPPSRRRCMGRRQPGLPPLRRLPGPNGPNVHIWTS